MYDDSEIIERKKTFAAAFLKTPLDPMAAALATDPRHQYATVICNTWQFDDDVQRFMREINETTGPASRIPTRDEIAVKLFQEAQVIRSPDISLKYYELLAKIMGYIEKPATTQVNVNNVVDNRKVIMLPATANLDQWEADAIEQQKEITSAGG